MLGSFLGEVFEEDRLQLCTDSYQRAELLQHCRPRDGSDEAVYQKQNYVPAHGTC